MFENDKFNKKKLTFLLKKMALNDNLRAKEYKVLLFLLPELRKGEYVEVSQADISKQTGMTRDQISKAIRNLYNEDIITYDIKNNSWHKEIRLVIDSFEDINYEINSAIAQNTGHSYNTDDDDDDDDI